MGSWVQVAFPNEPSSQNSTDWVACGLPRNSRKLATDSNMRRQDHPAQDQLGGRQLTARARRPGTPRPWPPWRPARCRPTGPTPPGRRTPRTATPRWPPRWPLRTRPAGTGRPARCAPSACTTVPAVVSAAPTRAASSTRGRRICHTISSATETLAGDRTGGRRPPATPGTGSTRPTRSQCPSTITAASTSVQPTSTAPSGARSRRRPVASPERTARRHPPRSVVPGSVSTAVAASSLSIGEPSGIGSRTRPPNEPAFAPRASHVGPQPGDRTRPPEGGLTVAGQCRARTGLRWAERHPGLAGAPRT